MNSLPLNTGNMTAGRQDVAVWRGVKEEEMKNLRIGKKLLITFMLIILLFIGTVVIAIRALQENSEKYSDFYNVGYQITNKVMSMRRGLQVIVKDLSFITIEEDRSKSDAYLSDMQKELDLLQENGNWLFSNFTGDGCIFHKYYGCCGVAE